MPSSSLFLRAGAILSALSTTALAGAGSYELQDTYAGNSFLNGFDFFTDADPTNGFVRYQSESSAANAELTKMIGDDQYIGVDYQNTEIVTNSGDGRASVRISTKKSYMQGLFIVDLKHMPGGICGTWPAFWSLGSGTWPQHGEIDIIEGVNRNSVNKFVLHTDTECSVDGTGQKDPQNLYNCALDSASGASGCDVNSVQANTYGSGFNSNGGGVYAMEWTDDAIKVWFFPRDQIPASITKEKPDVSEFGTPNANFQGDCDIKKKFIDHKFIFDTTFCGDWAGNVYAQSGCPMYSGLDGMASCKKFVAENPAAFREAYWRISSFKTFQKKEITSSSSSSSSMSSTSSSTSSSISSSTSSTSSWTSTTSSSSSSSTAVYSSSSSSAYYPTGNSSMIAYPSGTGSSYATPSSSTDHYYGSSSSDNYDSYFSSSVHSYDSYPSSSTESSTSCTTSTSSAAHYYGSSSVHEYETYSSSSVHDYDAYPSSTAEYPTTTPAPYYPSAYEEPHSYGGDVKTSTYTYVDVCSTGYTTLTKTTEYYPSESSPVPSKSEKCPEGFTITTKYCAKGCGAYPTTVTVTIPKTGGEYEHASKTQTYEEEKPYGTPSSEVEYHVYTSSTPEAYTPPVYSKPAPSKPAPSKPADHGYEHEHEHSDEHKSYPAPAPSKPAEHSYEHEYETYSAPPPSKPTDHSYEHEYTTPSSPAPEKPKQTLYATKIVTLSIVPVPASEYYAAKPSSPAAPIPYPNSEVPAEHSDVYSEKPSKETHVPAPPVWTPGAHYYDAANVTVSYGTATGKPSGSATGYHPPYFTGAAASVSVKGSVVIAGVVAVIMVVFV